MKNNEKLFFSVYFSRQQAWTWVLALSLCVSFSLDSKGEGKTGSERTGRASQKSGAKDFSESVAGDEFRVLQPSLLHSSFSLPS